MLRAKSLILVAAISAVSLLSVSSEAQAGPLLDWLRGMRRPANNAGCCGTQTPNYQVAPQQAAYTPNAYGLQPGQCMKTCQKECSRTVVSYVPYTAYRTNWNRVPVTQYKPVTNSDPCTGCTVTCMKPCTTYTYQMQRVPYTTYRPTYRTETYKVPVTTITNDCATGNCGTSACNTGCNTCGVSTIPNQAPVMAAPQAAVQNYIPNQNYQSVPSPSSQIYYENQAAPLTTGGGYGTSTGLPADQPPALQGISPTTSYRPVLDRLRGGIRNMTTSNETTYQNTTPVVRYPEQTARSAVRKEWNYSPVRLASYTSVAKPAQRSQPRTKSNYQPIQRPAQKKNNLNGWEVVK